MSAPTTHDPLVVTTQDGVTWLRRAVVEGRGLYAVTDSCKCPEYLMATLAELAEHGIAGSADVLPMPVGPVPSERERLRAAYTAALDEAHQTHPCPVTGRPYWRGCVHYDGAGRVVGVGSCHSERRADAVLAVRDAEVEFLMVEVDRKSARVAELERARLRVDEVERRYTFDTAELKRQLESSLVAGQRLIRSEQRTAELEAVLSTHREDDQRTIDGLRARVAELEAAKQHRAEALVRCRMDAAEQAQRETDPARRAAWRMLAEHRPPDGITQRIAPSQALREDEPVEEAGQHVEWCTGCNTDHDPDQCGYRPESGGVS